MKSKKLSERTIEELKKNEKALRILTGLLVAALTVLFIASMYITINTGFTPLVVMPITLVPVVLLNLGTINKIKKEIKSRT
ncbi:redox-active disulfide protein 2 [Flavobacterium orientale]|uniref:Redox-active disulfide protein 2 n=1 Tax=Flavobacterium orientale TaxID=1756020 RepID=A0A916Y4N7_9FLAO|nr:redox-active disulfide protein 2 [Flavobacterium orientale]GGD30774.1 hypothetical protein GCM10011343_21160 [Flavobacterium orientale]